MRRTSSQRRLFLWILSIVIVASMICSLVVSLAPPRAPRATATPAPVMTIARATDTPVPEATVTPQ
jgi:hypothetical protein